MGMNINTDKTATQLIGRYRGSCDIKLEGQVLSHVEDFVYLGGLIVVPILHSLMSVEESG